MNQKQVDKTHYEFSRYVTKKRWASIWQQLDEVIGLEPDTLLELGPGPGLFKALADHFGIKVETLDLDPELAPDYVASATALPFEDNSYDCVCAFQMLEHLPYEQSLQAFGEMARVAEKNVVISLPDAKAVWPYIVHIPKFGRKVFHFPRPRIKKPVHQFDGEHYWEINKQGYPLQKIMADFKTSNARLLRTFRVEEHPYHRFFIFGKNSA
jgi:predicted SAM-dependent methyltransferase